MSVRAEWFTAELSVDEADPFSGHAEQPALPIEEVGKPISLTDGEPKLRVRLIELVNEESMLHRRGITCAIRDRTDTNCNACPVRATDPRLVPLCNVGVLQEQVITALAVYRVQRAV